MPHSRWSCLTLPLHLSSLTAARILACLFLDQGVRRKEMISLLGRLRHWDQQRPNRRLFLAAQSCTFPAKSGPLRREDDSRWELVGRVSGGAADFPEGASQPVAMDLFPETAMMVANADF